ncbi:hypothetical protein BDW59DRAFT_144348 [Aspergillus cavernicola]|uniref:BZIP domain-containing protein n=1 Tax=Aspergillus cavernicola TaxID=176166 RepID=A0ABR4IHD3_9EURO
MTATPNLTAIPLMRMTKLAEIRTPDEDWTGKSCPAERRRLQNRLNQRTRRIRKQNKKQNERNTSSITIVGATPQQHIPRLSKPPEVRSRDNQLQVSEFIDRSLPPGSYERVIQFEKRAMESYLQGSPNPDHLITLSKLNFQRAVQDNMIAVGMSIEWTKDNNALSIFNLTGPSCISAAEDIVPPALQPTLIQSTTPHHPWLDVLPFPQIRDNLIKALTRGSLDERELCRDLMVWGVTGNIGLCMLVWGSPWDPRNWEITELFMRKWGWVLQECPEILVSTNQWRRNRGEGPLATRKPCLAM